MQDGARIAALIEIVDEWLTECSRDTLLPMEHLLRRYTKSRRYIGSKDRRYLQATFYEIMRQYGVIRALLEGCSVAIDGRSVLLCFLREQADLRELFFCGKAYHPAVQTEEERRWLLAIEQDEWTLLDAAAKANLPEWLYTKIAQQYGEQAGALFDALAVPADVDIRINPQRSSSGEVQKLLAQQGIESREIEGLGDGLSVASSVSLTGLEAYQQGAFEIQDRGSQWVMQQLPISSGMTVLDYCAGAGGKSLLLAAEYRKSVRIIAHDSDAKRLTRLSPRAERAGAVIEIMPQLPNPSALQADMVIVDAPCSGKGTIRRHPDLPWRLSESFVKEMVALQQSVLQSAAQYTCNGGYLLYITCSLLKEENEEQVKSFMKQCAEFELVPLPEMWNNEEGFSEFRRILPHIHQSDGFFAGLLRRREA